MTVIDPTPRARTSDVKITLRGIGKVFPLNKTPGAAPREFVALSEINLDIRRGEFLAIVGPSGSGKSTLLDILAGLAPINSGEALIDGRALSGPDLDRGIVLQGDSLFPWRTVRKNIEFGLEVKKTPKQERRGVVDRYLRLVGLTEFDNHFPHELSGGMKQRVALARALAYDPEILLMDEPFAAVDALTRETLQNELLSIWEATGKTIVFVTHSIEEAIYLSDRVAVLTSNPGTISHIIDVNLPRPRNSGDLRSSPEFGRIRHTLWQLLQGREGRA